ncbi:MAG: hypothetical protein O7G83_13670, partial [Proteobacteria bacterium]|nr:hypothetical protein [Pseudomonadota bacterium]
ARTFYKAYFSEHHCPDDEKDMIFDAALFRALHSASHPHSQLEKKWKNIQFAVRHRREISSVVR